MDVVTHHATTLCNLRLNILLFKAYASASPYYGTLARILAKWKIRRQAWNTDL